MRTPVSVRLFNLQPCKNFAFAVLLVANCRETLFSAKFRTNAIFNFKTAPLLRCFFCGENVRFGNFVKGSKILQRVQKFATSNYAVRCISNVFACSCRYEVADVLTCLCAVFENAPDFYGKVTRKKQKALCMKQSA